MKLLVSAVSAALLAGWAFQPVLGRIGDEDATSALWKHNGTAESASQILGEDKLLLMPDEISMEDKASETSFSSDVDTPSHWRRHLRRQNKSNRQDLLRTAQSQGENAEDEHERILAPMEEMSMPSKKSKSKKSKSSKKSKHHPDERRKRALVSGIVVDEVVSSSNNDGVAADNNFPMHRLKDTTKIIVLPNVRSDERADHSSDDISVSTHMSLTDAKLLRLADIAARWTGPISVAVYIRCNRSQDNRANAIGTLDAFREKHASTLRQTAFHLVVDEREDMELHYPHNFLRNVATEHSSTDRVMVIDVDFIPSFESHDKLVSAFKNNELLDADGTALVVPAFERKLDENESETSVTAKQLPATKEDLLRAIEMEPGKYTQFHQFFYEGHGPTDYRFWYEATEPYEVGFTLKYEPYVVVKKSSILPPFWEHFSGFGKNKAAWIEELAVIGFSFVVSNDSFLVHINHGYEGQDSRHARPFVIDEYAFRFLPYLEQTYGDTYWKGECLTEWAANQKINFVRKTFRMCRDAELPLNGTREFSLEYQCAGPNYLKFAREVALVASALPEPMGRRPFPLQDDSKVLVMGNSHTRQMAKALICQYHDQLVEYNDKVFGFTTGRADTVMARFRNNSTMIVLTNNPIAYSQQWQALVEGIIGRQLKDVDAIVVGAFNSFAESQETSFVNTVAEAAKGLEGVDFVRIPPPELRDFADVYDGKLVYVSMFASQGIARKKLSIQTMKEEREKNRTNIAVVDGRKYVDMMGRECGSDDWGVTGVCHENGDEDSNNHRLVQKMHRCVGTGGGHPDLIAREVIEQLRANEH